MSIQDSRIIVVQDGLVYNIAFKYNEKLVELVKQVPGKTYYPDKQMWSIPSTNLGILLAQLKGTEFEQYVQVYSNEGINQNAKIHEKTVIPNVDVSNIPFYVNPKYEPYKHQIDFMKYGVAKNGQGFIVGDDMRLGKTAEVLNIAEYGRHAFGYKHCLIICCINSSKYNWLDDIQTHFGPYRDASKGYILGTRKVKRRKTGIVEDRYDTGGAEKIEDLKIGHMYGDINEPELPYFLITNIESIRYRQGKNFLFAEQIVNMINSGEIGVIAIDEIHRNASPTSSQGKALLKIKNKTGRKCQWLPMTGTLIVNQPTDAFLPTKLVDAHTFNDFYGWCRYFCIYGGFNNKDIIAYKHMDVLKQIISRCMIRRLKSEVHDLPPKVRITEYVENTPTQKKLYENIRETLLQNSSSIVKSMNPMVELIKLRQVNGSPELIDPSINTDSDSYLSINAKVNKVLEILHEAVDVRGEKVVILSNWVEPLRTLYKFVSKKYKVCCFTGTMKSDVREKHKRVFQTNPNYPILIGTTAALGTAHTLTMANTLIFYDEPWTPSDREQAEDRIYGLDTTTSKNIVTIITKDTVDDKVHNIVSGKSAMGNFIVDGKMDIRSDPSIFYKLLGATTYVE